MSAPLAAGRPRLSVAIIARNAEEQLPDTLDTATQIADEVIVCDTGSTDATREIAARHGARVVDHRWNESFAAARNAAWNAATGDWILWLDAGERMSAEASQALRTFIDTQADPSRAYMMLVVVPPAKSNISGEQVGRIRLVPNRKEIRYSGRVRESIKPDLLKLRIGIDGLPWRIQRGQRDNDPQVKHDKAVRDLKLQDAAAKEEGQTPEILIALGEAMTVVGDTNGSIACFRKALETSKPGESVQREAYYGLLTALDVDPEQRQSQINVCLESLERFPLDAQLLCAMGGYMQAEGRLDMATRAYQTAFEYGQIDPEIWHVPDIYDIAAACLSLAQQLQNNDDAARRVLEQAIARNPSAMRLRRHLIDLHVKHDRRKEALAEFDLLPAETPHREALRSAIRGACLASRQNWTPALAYLQTAYNAGCRDVLCLRWLSLTLIATGDADAAMPILRAWHTLDPRSGEPQRYMESLELPPPPEQVAPGSPHQGRRLRIDGGQQTSEIPMPNLVAPKINIYVPSGVK